MNYATAERITGPYKRAKKPLMQTGDFGLTAPGGADIWSDGKNLVFHAEQGSDGSRAMYAATVTINGTVAVV